MANKWVTHDHSNYPPGGPESADYLADADEFNQNYEDICDAVGARYIRGVACADKNSTATTCEIWLQADGGERDVRRVRRRLVRAHLLRHRERLGDDRIR
jgi:hypothetical protein